MTAPGEPRADVAGRTIVIVSPHFDDVPLSLGQSLLDGSLSEAASVLVRVVFGRTNWSVHLHPTRGRVPIIGAWRGLEERLAARRFGYRVSWDRFEEVILRTGSLDAPGYRTGSDLGEDPLVAAVEQRLRQWRLLGDELWVPAGMGAHVDHRIVAQAAARVVREDCAPPVAFYEDRPYVSRLSGQELTDQLAELGLQLVAFDVSAAVKRRTQRAVQRIYRSQMNNFLVNAQRQELELGRPERIWRPVGSGVGGCG